MDSSKSNRESWSPPDRYGDFLAACGAHGLYCEEGYGGGIKTPVEWAGVQLGVCEVAFDLLLELQEDRMVELLHNHVHHQHGHASKAVWADNLRSIASGTGPIVSVLPLNERVPDGEKVLVHTDPRRRWTRFDAFQADRHRHFLEAP
ncbi:MAG: hypothetical protein OXU20_06985 [Myxococcales bacterium]|nr:hypothetical protein [Myxococcales bacterium]MDD9965627.1 hypothetical protein [Myxococcales bacterium]